jgi:phosphoribosylglycinamide formyltransferase 1
MTLKIAVLASTRGTDLQAIMDAIKKGELDADLRIVICNKECYALERAKALGFKAVLVPFEKEKDTRERYDQKVAQLLDEEEVELIVLVGYMRLLSAWFVNKYRNRIMNIHPSLLPSFSGMDRAVHEEVLKYGCKVSGCTIHFVDEGTDTGPIIAQACVDIDNDETIDSLKEKVQALEQKLYPKVIQHYAEGKIHVKDGKVIVEE